MNRRDFLSSVAVGMLLPNASSALVGGGAAWRTDSSEGAPSGLLDANVKDALPEVVLETPTEIILKGKRLRLLRDTKKRLQRLQKLVGYAHFNLIDYDMAMKYARNYSRVGSFTRQEKDFLEELFFADAARYGFLGDKVITKLDAKIPKRETIKIPASGHYIFRAESLKMYDRIRRDLGDNVVLTSGVRGIIKQTYLFLAKAVSTKGNLSIASRSLAPPGHSYHGIGDFDVGKVGYGHRNFTEDFAKTEEFRKLIELGYVQIRYTNGNPFGVRFEPWHIKVV